MKGDNLTDPIEYLNKVIKENEDEIDKIIDNKNNIAANYIIEQMCEANLNITEKLFAIENTSLTYEMRELLYVKLINQISKDLFYYKALYLEKVNQQ